MISQFIIILSATVAVFSVMGIGASARYVGWLNKEADSGLLKLIIRVLVPCLIFDKVVGNTAFDDSSNIYLPPLFGFGSMAIGCLVAFVFGKMSGRWVGLDSKEKLYTFAVCIGIYNYGFIPIVLVNKLFEPETLGVLFLHNVGVEFGIWTLGVGLITGGLTKGWWKHVLNPPAITIIVSLLVNAFKLQPYLPQVATDIITMLSTAAIPMMMLLIGATFFEQISGRKKEDLINKHSLGTAVLAIVLRIAVVPLLFLGAVMLLPASLQLKQVVLIEAAMPAAVFPLILTQHYGGSSLIALRVVISTTIIGLITIPLWISAGLWLLDLNDTVIPTQPTNHEEQVMSDHESAGRFHLASGLQLSHNNW
ncbi:MAG: transporter [Blastopirellula sp.]|nr:MAG: transporter [Blastopirellula sp.]